MDTDNDGVNDAKDQCVNTPLSIAVNNNGCPQENSDSDNDGINDYLDQYNNTPEGAAVDILGGVILPPNSFSLTSNTPSCPETATGYITFSNATDYYFDIKISGTNYEKEFERVLASNAFEISNLFAGEYTLQFRFSDALGADINGYKIIVGEAAGITALKLSLDKRNKKVKYQVAGAKKYTVYVNKLFKRSVAFASTKSNILEIPLNTGDNQIEIKGEYACQKTFKESIQLNSLIVTYPNPAKDWVYIQGAEGTVRIFNTSGGLLFEKEATPFMKIDISNYPSGIYHISINNFNKNIAYKHLLKK